MLDQTKNFLIGLFIIAALGITTYILLFLHPSMGDEGQTLKVRFSNIDKVNKGTRVLFAGHPVGEVTNIREVEGARSDHMVRQGEVYIYELTLQVDTSVHVYTSDEIMVSTAGLLGEKSIAITPMPPPPGQPLVRVTNQTLYAASPGSVEEAIKEFNNLAASAKKVMNQVSEQLETIDEGFFWENLSTSAANMADITTALNQPDDLRTIVQKVRDVSEGLSVLEQRVNSSWPKVEEAVDNLHAMSVSAKEAFDKVQNGEGTLGRLIGQDDLYLQTKSIMSKAETLMDDINHYGLLFNSDKGWQRKRARRANLMMKLRSPQQFENFFNDEVNQISTSISRVSQVLEMCEESDCGAFTSPHFDSVFSDLLRRIETLEENIQNYNEQVAELKRD